MFAYKTYISPFFFLSEQEQKMADSYEKARGKSLSGGL